ncbi:MULTISPECIES: hypothetical protein [unclassified Nesterenkonia]|uniref:hypothetical protein n=1 Tax=unclassified Nesterenkonia TaxID=2629769 RepID=UPI0021085A86|nr:MULTISPECIES: hypothetical protein [unclassified Nesterenkonia]
MPHSIKELSPENHIADVLVLANARNKDVKRHTTVLSRWPGGVYFVASGDQLGSCDVWNLEDCQEPPTCELMGDLPLMVIYMFVTCRSPGNGYDVSSRFDQGHQRSNACVRDYDISEINFSLECSPIELIVDGSS